jgi:hypothetical protein
MMDIDPTIEAIEAAASHLEYVVRELRYQVRLMREDGDLTRAAEAANLIAHAPGQCRLDLLVTRPLRAAGVK